MEFFITCIINGLSTGGVYAMIALGYTMVYGIAKMLNFAHGDIIMVGGYIIYAFVVKLQVFPNSYILSAAYAAFVAAVFCVLLGILVEKVACKA